MIVAVLYILALSFLYAAKVETVCIDKKSKFISIGKTNTYCIKTLEKHNLSSIAGIAIIKAGRKSVTEDSIHYKVQVNLTHGNHIRILETSKKIEAKRRMMVIKNFLKSEMDVPVFGDIIDESHQI